MNPRILSLVALVAVSTADAQKQPPIRQLGAVKATAAEPFTNVQTVRHLSNGNVLVNDIGGRRVLLLDAQLKVIAVVADTTPVTQNAYSGRVGGLVAYTGDSTLFVDPQSLSMLMIDPQGKVARVMSVPRAQDAMALSGMMGTPGLDPQGRLIYRGPLSFGARQRGPDGPTFPTPPESLPIVRTDLATRMQDTLGWTKVPKIRMNVSRDDNGRVSMTSEINPLPLVDDWAVLSTGQLALIRGQDYHIDWVNPDGSRVSSPKIPFEWQRLTDEDKIAFIDSVKAQRERMGAQGAGVGMPVGQMITMAGPGAGGPGGPPGGAPPGGGERVTFVGPGGGGGPGGPGGGGRGPNLTFIPPSELPDYKPPFFIGSARADADGQVWIRTIPTRAVPGGPVYDVINGKGELVERVQVPANRTIVGFGPAGVVYLVARDPQNATQVTLERATAK